MKNYFNHTIPTMLNLAKASEDFLSSLPTEFSKREFEACYNCISYLADLSSHYGYEKYAQELRDDFNAMIGNDEEK